MGNRNRNRSENQKTLYGQLLFPANRAFYEITLKIVEKPDRLQMVM